MIRVDLADAHPALLERWLLVVRDWEAPRTPWFMRVTRVLSTLQEQSALYAQGRIGLEEVNALRHLAGLSAIAAEGNHQVTKLDGVKKRSKHQGVLYKGRLVSLAIDWCAAIDPDGPAGPLKVRVDFEDLGLYRPVAALCEKHDLVSGGTWGDWPHLELPGPATTWGTLPGGGA